MPGPGVQPEDASGIADHALEAPQPQVSLGGTGMESLGVEPGTVVGDRHRRGGPIGTRLDRARWPRRRGARRCATPLGRRGKAASPPAGGGSGAGRGPRSARRAVGGRIAGQVDQCRLQAHLGQIGRKDVDEGRTEGSDAGPHRLRGGVQRRHRAGREGVVTGRAARAKVTPTRSWTTPSCRSLAMRRRSTSEASRDRCRSSSRSRWRLRSRAANDHAMGICNSSKATREPRDTGAKLLQMRRPAATRRRSGSKPRRGGVPRWACGWADRPRGACDPVRPGSRAGEVTDVGVDVPVRSGPVLVVAELRRSCRASAARVGVDDPPVGCPDLHPDERVIENVIAHDGIEAGQRRRVATSGNAP